MPHTVAIGRQLLGLYWGPRSWTLDESTERIVSAFAALEAAGYGTYFHKGRSRREAAQRQFTPGVVAVRELLRRGVNRRDVDRSVMAELGSSFSLWSGVADSEAYEVSVHVGSTASHAPNSFLLTLPETGLLALPGNELALRALFAKLVALFQPAQAIICAVSDVRWNAGRLAADIDCLVRHPSAA